MKVAIITGGSRGIGKSAALNVAKRGTGVILTYNSHQDEGEAVAAEIRKSGGKAAALKLDVTQTSSFRDFAGTIAQTLQKEWNRETFDFLVNNAGIAQRTPIKDTTEAQFDQLVNVHFKGPFFLTQELIPLMNDGGHIINISTGLTRFSYPGVATYASLKAAMEVFTVYLAKEFGHRKIRANIVAPGAIATQFGGGEKDDPQVRKMLSDVTALGRVGEAEDIGVLIAGLLSDDTRFVNAQRIEASGGIHI